MIAMPAQPSLKLPDARLPERVLGACKGLALAATAATIGLALSTAGARDAALGAACVVLAAWAGIAVLAAARSKPPQHLGLYVMACSSVRMLAALLLAVGVYFALPAVTGQAMAGVPFWVSFLITALGMLALETALVRSTIRRHSAARGDSPPAAQG
ncbi:MAG: hypothetical protein FJ255_10060 [Phycisphaerae bacterium]|nr:hypothetical protein [Phycisphaerae bacterium]